MAYLSHLSRAQFAWLIATVIASFAIVVLGWALAPDDENVTSFAFTTEMSIRDIAPKLDVTGKALARELSLPLDAPKGKTLKSLGVDQSRLDHVATHLLSHRPSRMKYSVFAVLVLWGMVYLVRLGRPDNSPVAERRTWYPRTPYIVALLVAVIVCGFVLGKSPNPMEGAVKTFKAMVGLYPSVWTKVGALAFFIGLAIVGDKLVCGWACPFGALQELAYSIPVLTRAKHRKLPFWLSNSIRATLFVLMLFLLFGIVGGRKGFVLYHQINPFNLFDLSFETWTIAATVVLSVALGLLIYRPFCQFICPFGFVSWLVEGLSLARIRINRDRCNQCGACAQACPSTAASHLLHGKLLRADCFSCARCLNVCPNEAIGYGVAFGRPGERHARDPRISATSNEIGAVGP